MRNPTYTIFVILYTISLLDFVTSSRVQLSNSISISIIYVYCICLRILFYTHMLFYMIVLYRFSRIHLYVHSLRIHLCSHYHRILPSSQCMYLSSRYIFVNEFIVSHLIIVFNYYIQYSSLLLVRSFIYLYDVYHLIFSIVIHIYSYLTFS